MPTLELSSQHLDFNLTLMRITQLLSKERYLYCVFLNVVYLIYELATVGEKVSQQTKGRICERGTLTAGWIYY